MSERTLIVDDDPGILSMNLRTRRRHLCAVTAVGCRLLGDLESFAVELGRLSSQLPTMR